MKDGSLPAPFLTTRRGSLQCSDAVEWMSSLEPGLCRLLIADPPYNMRKARWDRLGTPAQYLAWTRTWVTEAHRLLTPDGTIYLCGLPETLAEIAAVIRPMFFSVRFLVWSYRNKGNLGDDWGRSHEGILHLRKAREMVFNTDAVRVPYNDHTIRYPEHPQAATSQYGGARSRTLAAPAWRPHPGGARPRDVIEVPTLCNGNAEKTAHPTQKPVELIRRLVLASSRPGDLVIDPFGGAGTTYAVCEQTGRRWLGCEREMDFCRLIAARLAEPERFTARSAAETAQERARRRRRLRGAP